MADIASPWGGDIDFDARGDLLLVSGLERSQARILRRLMTILGEYVWHPGYGASVPVRIGDLRDTDQIESIVRSQIFLEPSVGFAPEPIITVSPVFGGVAVSILYHDVEIGERAEITFDLTQ